MIVFLAQEQGERGASKAIIHLSHLCSDDGFFSFGYLPHIATIIFIVIPIILESSIVKSKPKSEA